MTKKFSNDLGMNTRISRRDFMHGASLMAAGLMAGGGSFGRALAQSETATYPPALTGMRGNHPGSFEVAHKLGREGVRHFGTPTASDPTVYDLVIVGGGISGLSAAYFYKQEKPKAKILILDNHDDFGGHAKRNEFEVGGKKVIGYGGSQTIQEPSKYSREAKKLLRDLGIKPKRFDKAYDQDFYKRNGLRAGLFFSEEAWGETRMVPLNLGLFDDYLPLADTGLTAAEAVDQLPISDAAKKQFLDLMTVDEDRMSHLSLREKYEQIYYMSYRGFLEEVVGITEPEVFQVLQDVVGDSGVGIEATPALEAMEYSGMPGRGAAGLPAPEPFENYIHHFPDGNASVARLIVRELIPGVAPKTDPEEIVTVRFDYSKLDQTSSDVRIRLNSTVVQAAHKDQGKGPVAATYVQNGKAHVVTGKACIMACQHSIVPHLCPELPEAQKDALSFPERTPILYNTVAIRNWEAWKEIGIGALYAPGSYHIHATLDFPVSIGGYKHGSDPSDPAIVHMERFPHVNNAGMTKREQAQAGRYELLTTPFEEIENHIRAELNEMLSPGGFDPARDIEAITVNRWAHGYAYSPSPLFDDDYDDWDDPRTAHVKARKKFGRIAFANSDSGAIALLDCAIDQAYRAVSELT